MPLMERQWEEGVRWGGDGSNIQEVPRVSHLFLTQRLEGVGGGSPLILSGWHGLGMGTQGLSHGLMGFLRWRGVARAGKWDVADGGLRVGGWAKEILGQGS